jgi:hypothetical protein
MADNITDDIKDFLYVRKEGFTAKYAQLGKVKGRYHTMKAALNLFLQRDGKTIVETGCQRQENDWGGGMSTTIFGDFIGQFGGQLYTVDNSQKHLNLARKVTKQFDNIIYELSDSVAYLQKFDQPIDLLYLDSFDFPIEDLPGSWDCTLTDQELIEQHFATIKPCQEHCLKELEEALPNLHKKSIVLIDDNNLWAGGKPRLAREWLLDNQWEQILDEYQTLWIKKGDN